MIITAGRPRATLLVRAMDGILGTHRCEPTCCPIPIACRSGTTVGSVRQSWMVCADQPGVPVDEQIRHVVDRVLPYRDAIAALVAELGSAGGACLQVVRYFKDASGEEDQLSDPTHETE